MRVYKVTNHSQNQPVAGFAFYSHFGEGVGIYTVFTKSFEPAFKI